MYNTFDIGLDYLKLKDNGVKKPISRVTLWVDDEASFTSGDDTGAELSATCPFATQTITDSVLAAVKGHVQQMMTATSVSIDPAMELGDGFYSNGLQARIDQIYDDGCGYPSLEAKGKGDFAEEYPAVSPTQTKIKQSNAATRALIQKTADTIMLSVSATDNRVAQLELALEEVSISVGGTSGDVTKLSVKLDGVTITDSSGTTYLNGSTLQTASVKTDALAAGAVTADKIAAGVITADKLSVTGSIMFSDLDAATQSLINSGVTESEAVTIITNQLVSSPNIAGGKFKDLAQENWIEMGTNDSETNPIGYINHYCNLYSATDPVLVMGYAGNAVSGYNQWILAPFFNIALNYVQNENKMYAVGNWDFSLATVTGL